MRTIRMIIGFSANRKDGLPSSVAQFSAWNFVVPLGEKTSGNVLVKLTELSCGDVSLCRLRIPLRQASCYSVWIYGIVARHVCLLHLRSKIFLHRNTVRVDHSENLFVLNANRPPAVCYAQKYTLLLIT